MDVKEPPAYSAQAEDDAMVPYRSGTYSIPASLMTVPTPVELFGSFSINARAADVGIRTAFTVTGGHEVPGQPDNILQIIKGFSAQMKIAVCGAAATPTPVKLVSCTVEANCCAAVFNWQAAAEEQPL